jgi:hypothetical protein
MARAALIILTVSIVGLLASAWFMMSRLAERGIELVYFNEPVTETEFIFEDNPVTIERVDTDPEANPYQVDRAFRLSYRGESVDFPIVLEDNDKLPGLLGVEQWMRVLPMVTGAQSAEDAAAKLASGDIKPRMIVAARYPAEGYDAESWGLVRRSEWGYWLAELNPTGPEPITLTQKTYRELDALHTPGKYTPEDMIPTPEQRTRDLWQHYAMQQVTPSQFFRAKDRNLDSALEAMGWTWPAAGLSGLGIMISFALLGMARVGNRKDL